METTYPEKNDWKRLLFMGRGIALFLLVYYSPPWPDVIDPMGNVFVLSKEAKGAIAIFLPAGIWWVFEVAPIGITSLAIGALQTLFLIRPVRVAFTDFMDPSVLFIFGSIVIAPYLGVAGEVILSTSLVSAGMLFLFLVSAAPNAIAYNSNQFTICEFFFYGIPASLILMAVICLAVLVIWTLMGMSITLPSPDVGKFALHG